MYLQLSIFHFYHFVIVKCRLISDHSVLKQNYEKARTELSKHREKKTIKKTETVRY